MVLHPSRRLRPQAVTGTKHDRHSTAVKVGSGHANGSFGAILRHTPSWSGVAPKAEHEPLAGNQRLVLVLDTCEHVIGAAATLGEAVLRSGGTLQCRDLKLQVLCRYYDARPHPADELFFRDERAICFQKDHEEIEGARAEFDRNTIGEQLPPSQ